MCKMYDVTFQELPDAVEQSSKEITEVDAVLCTPPYDTRGLAESASSEYDRLSLEDMSSLGDVSVEMDQGADGHILCFVL